MQTIHLIDNIFIENGTLRTYDREGKETIVFLKRGDLVGKCSVYSIMMMLILHKRINPENVLSIVYYEDTPEKK